MQSWYDEVKDYTYPYPHECNPWCPERCSGAMCTHYTQVIWVPQTWGACLLRQMQECLLPEAFLLIWCFSEHTGWVPLSALAEFTGGKNWRILWKLLWLFTWLSI